MNAPTRLQRRIENALGVSHAGLTVLARLKAGTGRTGGMAGVKLLAQGYVSQLSIVGTYGDYTGYALTDSGGELLARARAAGW